MDAVIRERLAACSTHTLLLFLRAGGKAILIFLHNCYCAHTHQLRMIGSRVAVGLHADLVTCRSKTLKEFTQSVLHNGARAVVSA